MSPVTSHTNKNYIKELTAHDKFDAIEELAIMPPGLWTSPNDLFSEWVK